MIFKKQQLSMMTLLLVGSTLHVQAQMDTTQIHPLSEVNVIATQPKVASDALRIITTITAKEIQSLPVQNINELLDYLPGVDIRTRGSNGAKLTFRCAAAHSTKYLFYSMASTLLTHVRVMPISIFQSI
ncbi:MAG: TonB-dependent receptor plug domain-containing protein [Prevotellaceae bacterium]|nr:TonB-dependent receptor plug domain-containing protein [Prevotellaceae bacterium]